MCLCDCQNPSLWKMCIVISSPNWRQQPLAQHTQVLYSCLWWISCLLAWFPLVLTQHNTVNLSGWLENIPLKDVNKHELRVLCWRLSYKCNISAVGQYTSAIFFLLTAAWWILTVSCNHIKCLPAIFFLAGSMILFSWKEPDQFVCSVIHK